MCVCSRVRCVFAPMRVDYMCVCLCFSEFVCFLMCAKVCFSHVCVAQAILVAGVSGWTLRIAKCFSCSDCEEADCDHSSLEFSSRLLVCLC